MTQIVSIKSVNIKKGVYKKYILTLAFQVCFMDTIVITYRTVDIEERRIVNYEMGCNYGYLCFDGMRYGPGPFGYSTIVRQCCCSNNCVTPDGTGRGKNSQCIHAQFNESTLFNSAERELSSRTLSLITLTSVFLQSFVFR